MPSKKNNKKINSNNSNNTNVVAATQQPVAVEEPAATATEQQQVVPEPAPATVIAPVVRVDDDGDALHATATERTALTAASGSSGTASASAMDDEAAAGLTSPTTILVSSNYRKGAATQGSSSTGYGYGATEATHTTAGDGEDIGDLTSSAAEATCMRERIEAETPREAIKEFLHLFLVNAATWGIWNTLDLAVLLTMAAFLASGDVFAGVATAMTITSLTALSVSNGMSSALETLISNAHGADRYSPLIPRYLRASMLVNVTLFLPMAAVFVFVPYSTLEWMFPHGNPMMLEGMQTWLIMSPFVIMPQIISACLQKYVICQRRPEVVTRSASLSVVVLPPLLYAATKWASPMAFAVAIAVDKTVLLVAMLLNILWDGHLRSNLYVHSNYGEEDDEEGAATGYSDVDENEMRPVARQNSGSGSSNGGVRHTSSSANSATNREIAARPFMYYVYLYIHTGYPSAIAFCIDTWTFELMTILSARCGPTQAAAWVLMQQLTHPIFATANGLASAAATDVGNAFGAECLPTTVEKKVRIASVTSVVVGVVGSIVLYYFGPMIFPYMIHNAHESEANAMELRGQEDQYSAAEAMAIGEHNIPLFAAQVLFDIPFFTLQGVYRGLNKQAMSAKIVFVALWVIAVPMAFAWPSAWGGCIRGILVALLFGSSVGAVALYAYIARYIKFLIKHHFVSEA